MSTENSMNNAIMDFGFYSGYDAIKKRGIPDMDQFLENGVSGLGYNFLVKDQVKRFDYIFPGETRPFGDMILKFGGQLAIIYLWRWGMKKGSKSIGDIILKQLISQGSQEVFKKV